MRVKAPLRGTSCYSTQLFTRKAAVLGVRVKSREPSNTETPQFFFFSHNALLHGNSVSGQMDSAIHRALSVQILQSVKRIREVR